MKILLRAGVLLALLAGCQPEPGPNPLESTACGGALPVQTSTGMQCAAPTRDAGKACTSSPQCETLCLAETGTCAPYLPYFGCHETLENGKGGQTVCVD